jgi:hypothetical protein
MVYVAIGCAFPRAVVPYSQMVKLGGVEFVHETVEPAM